MVVVTVMAAGVKLLSITVTITAAVTSLSSSSDGILDLRRRTDGESNPGPDES